MPSLTRSVYMHQLAAQIVKEMAFSSSWKSVTVSVVALNNNVFALFLGTLIYTVTIVR